MSRRFSILMGAILILMGGLALAFTLAAPALELGLWSHEAWRVWPLVVIGLGVLFVGPPLLTPGKRALGVLFIPGVPILATGAILCYASLTGRWESWAWLWPIEVVALAAGFLLAAIFVRTVWLLLPAIVIGTTAAILQFCVATGEWEAWAVLWTFEPLALGVAFLLINLRKRSTGLLVAGLVACAVAAVGLIGMTAVLPEWRLASVLGPAILVLVGLATLISSLAQPAKPQAAIAQDEVR